MWSWLNLSFTKLRKRSGADGVQAHMTFGQSSLGRGLTRTRLVLQKQLWIWPIVAIVLLSGIGYGISRSIQQTMEATLRSELETLRDVERSMLEKWLKVQESSVQTLANSPQVRRTVLELLAAQEDAARPDGENEPVDRARRVEELHAQLAREVEPSMSSHGFVGYVVADKRLRIVAAYTPDLIGKTIEQYEGFLSRALDGAPTVSPPFPSISLLKDSSGKLRSGTPTMFACAPVRDENLQVVAVLAMRIRPEAEFTAILQLGRIGRTGETYAVNKEGVMVSNSRFDEELILVGLLPDVDGAASILNVQVRDPGGNLLEGFRPAVRRREQPLTASAAAATSGGTGSRLDGYRDYRGVPQVGAWTWLPEYEIGVITEIAYDEAFRPLSILRWSFFSMFALLGLSAAAIFVFTLVVARLRREAQKAEIEAKQLGQYRLLQEIGSGAMGVVYKGQHAMLRRPTAIKMLNVDRVNEASIQRFEREVQITCSLNNPHTVAIYDYGRTPEGVFYYAMEYLDGIDLQSLVERDGPQPEGRVASILRQVCASLYEAHAMGLVHRDVKPANVMLNRRGGEPDVVKVLDFGLVKALEDERDTPRSMSGTPLYMSPEAIQTPHLVDGRSDLYALGAVGYFLLTGETAFRAQTLSELCEMHVSAIPQPPSQRLGRAVSAELEHAILACLEKNRAKRPQTARDLAAMLDRVPSRWTLDDAEAWWSRFERGRTTGRTPAGAVAADPTAATRPPAAETKGETLAHLERTSVFEAQEDAEGD